MVPGLIWMGVVVVKLAPWKEVIDFAYNLPTSVMASSQYPRSSIMANS